MVFDNPTTTLPKTGFTNQPIGRSGTECIELTINQFFKTQNRNSYSMYSNEVEVPIQLQSE